MYVHFHLVFGVLFALFFICCSCCSSFLFSSLMFSFPSSSSLSCQQALATVIHHSLCEWKRKHFPQAKVAMWLSRNRRMCCLNICMPFSLSRSHALTSSSPPMPTSSSLSIPSTIFLVVYIQQKSIYGYTPHVLGIRYLTPLTTNRAYLPLNFTKPFTIPPDSFVSDWFSPCCLQPHASPWSAGLG